MKKTILMGFFTTLFIFLVQCMALAQEEYVPDEVLIKFKTKVGKKAKVNVIDSVLGKIKGRFRLDGDLLHLKVPKNIGTKRAISILTKSRHIKYAVRNNIHHIDSTFANDPRFNGQWPLHNTGQSGGKTDADMDAPEAWDLFTGSPNIVVAVLDTGVDYLHADLAANIWTNPGEIPGNGQDDDGNGYVDDVHGYDFAYDDGDPMDGHSHGTSCAGIIGGVGDNGIGITGVNWTVRIMCVKVLNDSGSGTSAMVINGIDYATNNGAYMTSNSYGCSNCYNQAVKDAIERANNAGLLFVAAAGNSGVNTDINPHYPASYNNENIISVTATNRNDNHVYNYGPTTVDMAGFSPEITTTTPGNGYTSTFSGTSAATPHVTGVAALVWGYEQGLPHMQVKNRLMETVRPVASLSGKCVTEGAVNAYDALSAGGPPPPPPGAPSGLAATVIGYNQIDLSWIDNSANEDGFRIERREEGASFSEIGTVEANVIDYNDTTVKDGTTFYYQVMAYNAGGDSDASNEASVTTELYPPSDLVATAKSTNQIDLTWTDNSSSEDGYKIERRTGTEGFSQIFTTGPNVESFSDTGLAQGTTYEYQIRAYKAAVYSGYSNTASATTFTSEPPAAPSNLAATASSSSQIDLTWNDNSENEDGFKVERKTDTGGFTEIGMAGANITSFSDTGLNPETTYTYQLRAYNEYGDSVYSNETSATTLPIGGEPPAAPSYLSALMVWRSFVFLIWLDNSDNEDGFRIYRGTSSTNMTFIGTLGANRTYCINWGLRSRTTYYYKVCAYNEHGESCSNILKITTR
jgi:hypothetical protein